jgi:hypothetical protein
VYDHKATRRKAKKECATGTEIIFDIGSLYEQFEKLSDRSNAKGLRYFLSVLLVLITMAKMSGEDQPSGIAEWTKYRGEEMAEMLKLKRKTMPHHTIYRRIMAQLCLILLPFYLKL